MWVFYQDDEEHDEEPAQQKPKRARSEEEEAFRAKVILLMGAADLAHFDDTVTENASYTARDVDRLLAAHREKHRRGLSLWMDYRDEAEAEREREPQAISRAQNFLAKAIRLLHRDTIRFVLDIAEALELNVPRFLTPSNILALDPSVSSSHITEVLEMILDHPCGGEGFFESFWAGLREGDLSEPNLERIMDITKVIIARLQRNGGRVSCVQKAGFVLACPAVLKKLVECNVYCNENEKGQLLKCNTVFGVNLLLKEGHPVNGTSKDVCWRLLDAGADVSKFIARRRGVPLQTLRWVLEWHQARGISTPPLSVQTPYVSQEDQNLYLDLLRDFNIQIRVANKF